MNLTEKQIQHLFDFTRQHRVRYRDVQIELVDHLASAIEEKISSTNSISFERALKEVYKSFGIYGFTKIVQKKEKAMHMYWVKKIWTYFMEFFHWPKIMGTVSVMILLMMLLKYQLLPLKVLEITFIIFAFTAMVYMMYQNYLKDNQIRDFLYIKSFYAFATGAIFAFFYLPIYLFNRDFTLIEKFQHSDWYNILLAVIIPSIAIVFYLIIVRIPNELKKTFYQEHKDYLTLIG